MKKKNILEENLKRFGTKNLNEQELPGPFIKADPDSDVGRMQGLSNAYAQQDIVQAARVIRKDLFDEGFEREDIMMFLHRLVAQ